MDLLFKLLIAVLVGIAILFVVGFLLPGAVDIEHSIEISASPAQVFPFVADLHRWQAWCPWAQRDADRMVSFEGPESGVGATLRWRSQDRILETGRLEITEVESPRRVESQLRFGDQWEAETYVTMEPTETGAVVAWGLDWQLEETPIARFRGLGYRFLIGREFDRGLTALKAAAEAGEETEQ